MAKYTLHVELDPIDKSDLVEVTLYASIGDSKTGLMNCNKLTNYISDNLLAEDSYTPLVTSKDAAHWLVGNILNDWRQWENFLDIDLEGQDMC